MVSWEIRIKKEGIISRMHQPKMAKMNMTRNNSRAMLKSAGADIPSAKSSVLEKERTRFSNFQLTARGGERDFANRPMQFHSNFSALR